jgi:hypothetical protein
MTMSSFIVVGFFALRSGRRVRTPISKANGSTAMIWHVHYKTTLTCQDPLSLLAELQNYNPINNTVFDDDSIAFMVLKVYIPPGNVASNVLLEALYIAPLPGDLGDDSYDDHLPNFPHSLVFGLRMVTAPVDSSPDSCILFPVSLSDYVQGSLKQSTIQ